MTSCVKPAILKVQFDNVAGLDEKSPVLMDGLNVGEVINMQLQPSMKILVELQLNENVIINDGAEFSIKSFNLLGNKGVMIENGNSSKQIDCNEVFVGENEKSILDYSTVVDIVSKLTTKITVLTKQDSAETGLDSASRY